VIISLFVEGTPEQTLTVIISLFVEGTQNLISGGKPAVDAIAADRNVVRFVSFTLFLQSSMH
jgi:hypothetical protein